MILSFASITGLTETGVSGLALGALYGLIALGFVIVYKATRVINLAHGASALLGAYFCYWLHVQHHIPYVIAGLLAMVMCAIVGMATERFLIEPMLARGIHASLMVTLGVLIIVGAIVSSIWGTDQLNPADPWALNTVHVGHVAISTYDISCIVIAAVAVLAFFLFFRYSLLGTAIRATAFNREAAAAQGINPKWIGLVSWGIAGALGALAGILLSTTVAGGVDPNISSTALIGLSAIILGGLDSTGGAVVGGIIIGLAQQYAAGYIPSNGFGEGVASVLPYAVMLVILIIRPTGLWGTADVRRI